MEPSTVISELREQLLVTSNLLEMEKLHTCVAVSHLSLASWSGADNGHDQELRFPTWLDENPSAKSNSVKTEDALDPNEIVGIVFNTLGHPLDVRPDVTKGKSEDTLSCIAVRRLLCEEEATRQAIELKEVEMSAALRGYDCRVAASADILQHQLLTLLDHAHYNREALAMQCGSSIDASVREQKVANGRQAKDLRLHAKPVSVNGLL